jgi:hypothetical protein
MKYDSMAIREHHSSLPSQWISIQGCLPLSGGRSTVTSDTYRNRCFVLRLPIYMALSSSTGIVWRAMSKRNCPTQALWPLKYRSCIPMIGLWSRDVSLQTIISSTLLIPQEGLIGLCTGEWDSCHKCARMEPFNWATTLIECQILDLSFWYRVPCVKPNL